MCVRKGSLLIYQMRIFTLRDGTKRKVKVEEEMTLKDGLNKAGITESDVFQMQLVIQDDKMYFSCAILLKKAAKYIWLPFLFISLIKCVFLCY
ncbi:hypothetical protein DC421_03825 [Priestia megaterium]|nr:hypothetical protein DC428_11980 [Priestia megaterium]PVE89202.1 hypothetical protein DC421_03825 [Priestia megaterium]PVE92180.1 hypothetical protein DC433_26295 [Priestia megaterium]PVE92892.1 hypothetical protein DC426_05480 [Priestia megaterium]